MLGLLPHTLLQSSVFHGSKFLEIDEPIAIQQLHRRLLAEFV